MPSAACDDLDNKNISVEALDQMSDATAHAVLVFAMTKSAIEGTGRGRGHYDPEFEAAHARK
jgi:hypothetical protein